MAIADVNGLRPAPEVVARPVPSEPSVGPERVFRLCRAFLWANLYLVILSALVQPVLDVDLWWHLRTGQWIAEHGTVPQVDPFQDFAHGQPWMAYSWLYELVIYRLHAQLGLTGILLFRLVMDGLVVAALHRLVVSRKGGFLPAFGAMLLGTIVLTPILAERSYLITLLGVTLTLNAVLAVRDGRETWKIWLLPLFYVLWVNWHIQFIYGLFILGLACVAPLIGLAKRPGSRSWSRLALLGGLCFLATFVNPYHGRLYLQVLEYGRQTGQYTMIVEMLAPEFREIKDWALLALALLGAWVLGRRRAYSLFEIVLLGFAAFTSFRSRRDVWFLVVVASALVGACPTPAVLLRWQTLRLARPAAVAALMLLTLAFLGGALVVPARLVKNSEKNLQAEVAHHFPVAAVDQILRAGYRGPIYDDYGWGGYLLYRLGPDHPVAIDNRSNLHGDERMRRFIGVWTGQIDWAADPELARASIIIGKTEYSLAQSLRHDARSPFRLVYEDDVAVVYVRK